MTARPILAVVGALALAGCRATTTTTVAPTTTTVVSATTTTASKSTSTTATPVATTTSAVSVVIPDGQYAVPGDIAPGLYRVGSYYARRDANDKIIEDDIVSGGGFTLMLVKATDATVEIRGGAVPIEKSNPIDSTTKTDGVYLVGFDVAPGNYKVTPDDSGSASYARLDKDLKVIDDDIIDGELLVTISPTDFAFTFSGHLEAA